MVEFVTSKFLWAKRLLFCEHCETSTVHALSKSGDYYSCGCGSIVKIIYIEETNNE